MCCYAKPLGLSFHSNSRIMNIQNSFPIKPLPLSYTKRQKLNKGLSSHISTHFNHIYEMVWKKLEEEIRKRRKKKKN